MTSRIYYLDYAAATPMDERVLDAMKPFFSDHFFNPSSPYAPAVEVRRRYEEAKSLLARSFGARGEELVITAGATESINLAFSGVVGHVVTSAIEHDAVLKVAGRHDITLVNPTANGTVAAEAVATAIRPTTELVSIQLANNEIGTVQPIRAIAEIVIQERKRRQEEGNITPIWFHCDASQGFGQIDVNVARLGVDMLTLNAGKMYGPKQVGLLWRKPSIELQPVIVGGGQENGLRSGTENVAGVVGFSVAADLAAKHRNNEASRLSGIRDDMQRLLLSAIPDLVITGNQKKRLPGSLHIALPGIDGERMVFRLEARGVLVATGSACAANKGTRSHVLTAIGMSNEVADASLRITLGRSTTEEDARAAADIIIEELNAERERMQHA